MDKTVQVMQVAKNVPWIEKIVHQYTRARVDGCDDTCCCVTAYFAGSVIIVGSLIILVFVGKCYESEITKNV